MMDSNDKLTIEGASIYTNGNLYLRGRNGVELRPGMASSYYLEVYKKSGLSANLSIGKGGLSAGIGYGKMKSVYEETRLDVIKNQIYAGGNYTVVSENGNYSQISTDIDVIGNASITAKDIIIGDAQSKVEIKQEQSNSYAGIGISIGIPIVSSAIAIVDAARSLTQSSGGINALTGLAGLGTSIYNAVPSAKALMPSLTEGITKFNPFAVNFSFNVSKSKSKYQSEASNSIGSLLNVGGNLELNGDNLNITGSSINVNGNLDLNIINNILVEAGRNTFTETSKSSSYSLSLSKSMMDNSGLINPFKDKNNVTTIGFSTNKSWGDGVNWSESGITVLGNTNYNVGGDVTYKGAIITTGSVSGTIGGNLYIETLQDIFNGGQKGVSISVGIGFSSKDGASKGVSPYLSSAGIGFTVGKIETKLSNDITSFTANGGSLDVDGKLTQIGSLIDGSFALNASDYEFQDLKDVYKDYYVNANLDFNFAVLYSKRDENGKRLLVKNLTTPIMIKGWTVGEDIWYRYRNQTRDVKATIGSGVITNFDTKGVNRDISQMVGDWEGTDIKETHVNLGTEYWLTTAGRGVLLDQIDDAKQIARDLKRMLTMPGSLRQNYQYEIKYWNKWKDKGPLDVSGMTQEELAQAIKERNPKYKEVYFYNDSDLLPEAALKVLMSEGFVVTKDGTLWINQSLVENNQVALNKLFGHEDVHIEDGKENEAKYAERIFQEATQQLVDGQYISNDGLVDWGISNLTATGRKILNKLKDEDVETSPHLIFSILVGIREGSIAANEYADSQKYSVNVNGPYYYTSETNDQIYDENHNPVELTEEVAAKMRYQDLNTAQFFTGFIVGTIKGYTIYTVATGVTTAGITIIQDIGVDGLRLAESSNAIMQKVGNLLSQGSLKIQQVYNYFTVDNGSALINSVTNNNSTQKSVSVTTKTLTKAEQIKENAAKGKQGELLAGVDPTKPKERIDSYSPKVEYRIPDILNHDETFLVEVKNVTKLSLTEQLRDFILWTQERGYKFILITRDDTTISKPLQEMINAGKIIWQTFKTK